MTTEQDKINESDSVFCAHCGTRNEKDAYSCDRCGERIYFPDPLKPPPMGLVECQKCVTPNESHASYCVKCGESLEHAARISVLGGGDSIRQVPHSPPGGIRISQRSRDASPSRASSRPERRPRQEVAQPQPVPEKRERDPEQEARQRDAARAKAFQQHREQNGESESENNSGTRSAKLPQSARGWNTAAFLIGPIWGPANGVWLGLIGLVFLVIPEAALVFGWKLILYLGFGMFLGYRGNEMAWRARRWASLDHFKRVQQQWMLIALVLNLPLFILVSLVLN